MCYTPLIHYAAVILRVATFCATALPNRSKRDLMSLASSEAVTNWPIRASRTMRVAYVILDIACWAEPYLARTLLAQQVVVVELFTSEGCSSCPPADALLGQLSKQRDTTSIELVLLGEHVEYWNGQGWNDRLLGASFTQRQYDYAKRFHLASAYTPQMVIDGHLQTTGGNAPAMQKLIADAAHAPKPPQSRSTSSHLASSRFR